MGKNRHSLFVLVIIFYFLPLLFFSAYSIQQMSQQKSWMILSLGLVLISICTLLLISLLTSWVESLRKQTGTSSLPLGSSAGERETKVTFLAPELEFEQRYSPSQHSEINDSSKEFNLLQSTLKANQEQQERMQSELFHKTEEWEVMKNEKEELETRILQVTQDFSDYKLFSEEQLRQKQLQMNALQQIMEDQRSEMEKRQEQIHQLDTKIHDLSYEIKTLLYLHQDEQEKPRSETSSATSKTPVRLSFTKPEREWDEISSANLVSDSISYDGPIRSNSEAEILLRKCIDYAQKLSGSQFHGTETSRYREFSSSYLAIDQRRLFDHLRSESRALLIVYSLKEGKLLFANGESKNLLGWHPDKFVIGFHSILVDGAYEWRNALQSLTLSGESHTRVLAKTAEGQEILIHCQLGLIQGGLFRNYVLGVLFPA